MTELFKDIPPPFKWKDLAGKNLRIHTYDEEGSIITFGICEEGIVYMLDFDKNTIDIHLH